MALEIGSGLALIGAGIAMGVAVRKDFAKLLGEFTTRYTLEDLERV